MVEDNTDLMMPFASSLRSELVVEAPDSLTSAAVAHEAVLAASANSSSGLEKAARMEDISFQAGQPPHREIDWGQGVPVRGNQRGTGDQDSVGGAGARILAAEGGGGQGDGSIPISSIEFDYPPPAPPSPPPAQLAGRASSVGVGNLYENMAKQMAAFLAGAGA